jgi:hypothetical protein
MKHKVALFGRRSKFLLEAKVATQKVLKSSGRERERECQIDRDRERECQIERDRVSDRER